MPGNDIGVAVIGAGMAGRAHAAGYRSATTLYGAGLPQVRGHPEPQRGQPQGERVADRRGRVHVLQDDAQRAQRDEAGHLPPGVVGGVPRPVGRRGPAASRGRFCGQ